MAGAPVAGEGGRQRRLARRELIRRDCLRPLQHVSIVRRACDQPSATAGRGARRASVPRPVAGDRPAGARRRLQGLAQRPEARRPRTPRPRPKRGPCPPVGPPAAPRRAGRAAGGGLGGGRRRQPQPYRHRRRGLAGGPCLRLPPRRARRPSPRGPPAAPRPPRSGWQEAAGPPSSRRGAGGRCRRPASRAKVSAVPASKRGAMLGPGRVPPRAALGDLVVERDVGAPGQGVARPARRLRVSGCLPLACRRCCVIALGALQRLGHRLDLRDLGKPRLRRHPPVGRQAGGQIGGGAPRPSAGRGGRRRGRRLRLQACKASSTGSRPSGG